MPALRQPQPLDPLAGVLHREALLTQTLTMKSAIVASSSMTSTRIRVLRADKPASSKTFRLDGCSRNARNRAPRRPGEVRAPSSPRDSGWPTARLHRSRAARARPATPAHRSDRRCRPEPRPGPPRSRGAHVREVDQPALEPRPDAARLQIRRRIAPGGHGLGVANRKAGHGRSRQVRGNLEGHRARRGDNHHEAIREELPARAAASRPALATRSICTSSALRNTSAGPPFRSCVAGCWSPTD